MNQSDLFSETAPYQPHSTPSRQAAGQIQPHLGRLQNLVLACVRQAVGGLTDEEIQDVLQLGPSTERPRRIELVAKGLVKDSGRTRPGRSGRAMTVWVAAS